MKCQKCKAKVNWKNSYGYICFDCLDKMSKKHGELKGLSKITKKNK